MALGGPRQDAAMRAIPLLSSLRCSIPQAINSEPADGSWRAFLRHNGASAEDDWCSGGCQASENQILTERRAA